MLTKIILHDVKVRDLWLSFREDDLVKEVSKAIILDKVETKSQMLNVGLRILQNTISNSHNSLFSQSIVAKINKFKSWIDFQDFSQSPSTIYINHISIEINVLESFIFDESLSDSNCTWNSEFTLTKIEYL